MVVVSYPIYCINNVHIWYHRKPAIIFRTFIVHLWQFHFHTSYDDWWSVSRPKRNDHNLRQECAPSSSFFLQSSRKIEQIYCPHNYRLSSILCLSIIKAQTWNHKNKQTETIKRRGCAYGIKHILYLETLSCDDKCDLCT